MYRWHFRKDISDVMVEALFDPDLPELAGFEYFFEALKTKTKNNLVNDRIIRLVAESRPSGIIDYGCGRGAITEALAGKGFPVVGYDPDVAVLERNRAGTRGAHYIGPTNLANLKTLGEKFDSVICCLVLCTIGDNNEVTDVIRDLRMLVAEGGGAIVALCNPFSTFVPESETHIKLDLPEGAHYQQQFVYHKKMQETGKIRQEVHRPFSWYKHLFHREGFEIAGLEEIRTTDIWNLSPSSDFLILKLKPLSIPKRENVSLLIRASAMEWQTIDFQIRHIVSQLEGPQVFSEKIVVTDTFTGPFVRQYTTADWDTFRQNLDCLLAEGIIDRVIVAPDDPETIAETNRRWLGIPCRNPRSGNGQPTFMTLYGFDQCRGNYILQMDSDCLIARQDRDHDYLGDMIGALCSNPDAVTVSFNVAKPVDEPYTTHGAGEKWRAEVRCALIDNKRLASALPLSNHMTDTGILQLPWHRALDETLEQSHRQSLRGGDRRTFYIHVPNSIKPRSHFWFTALRQVEQRKIPAIQNYHVDLAGTLADWTGLLDTEYVFIIRGKDVPISKLLRCMDSVARQNDRGIGMVFIDAGSTNQIPEYISEVLLPAWGERARALFNSGPLTSAENNAIAIREICSNIESVIITLDMDDALIGDRVIECLREHYQTGADLTVGSMLRTDKWCEYPATFEDPRKARGGNVWQHLRSFKKYLFDAIPESYLRIDGEWIPSAEDWAFMIPMVEMAERPVYIEKKLYFYEPTGKKDRVARMQREDLIGQIVGKTPLNMEWIGS
jgi:2-polyprenyl-3-methyl-5-hydroxy-6-metoxy-1,4-benzoquinol methylase